uniref:Terpenoid synthase n=1 Tax=Mycena chlorophos TaxID=658473 RepID=A0ABQ0LAX9_MYCCL|nr:predicted protein [Mycena chlorophos]
MSARKDAIPTADSYPIFDLQTYCGYHGPTGRFSKEIKVGTKLWFEKYKPTVGGEGQLEMLRALNPAVLATSVYPGAGYTQQRFCSDFLAYLFMLDEISDELDIPNNVCVADIVLNALNHPATDRSPARVAIMARELSILSCDTGYSLTRHPHSLIRRRLPGLTRLRFIEMFGYFFQSVEDQTQDRLSGDIPTLDNYIRLRRDTSACKLCWVVIEWAYNLDIPEDVLAHPVIYGLGEAVNDLVAWSNVCRAIFHSTKAKSEAGSLLLQRRAFQRRQS